MTENLFLNELVGELANLLPDELIDPLLNIFVQSQLEPVSEKLAESISNNRG